MFADILTLINELEKENETKTDTITDLLKKQEAECKRIADLCKRVLK